MVYSCRQGLQWDGRSWFIAVGWDGRSWFIAVGRDCSGMTGHGL